MNIKDENFLMEHQPACVLHLGHPPSSTQDMAQQKHGKVEEEEEDALWHKSY